MNSLISEIERLKLQREMETINNSELSYNELIRLSIDNKFSSQARIAILNKLSNPRSK